MLENINLLKYIKITFSIVIIFQNTAVFTVLSSNKCTLGKHKSLPTTNV